MPPKRRILEAVDTNFSLRERKKVRLACGNKQSPPYCSASPPSPLLPQEPLWAGFLSEPVNEKRKKKSRIPAAQLPSIPDFEPFKIPFPQHQAQALLPAYVLNSPKPISLFSLFWDNEVFEQLALHTNLYAKKK
ncbi:hypothetical protein C7212DRAFT_342022 [Tuber magnatum]|uniref:Uncharacterized protein n=1 Tax=Tuber magnatum TaxID=42249 RepID=A0A317T3H6_9PEZI|nr:hypothetical protein C7212DRAFT_342022 [Tuber magnatum]